MLRNILETSIFIKSFKKIYKWCYSIINCGDKKEEEIRLVLNNSKSVGFLLGLYKKSKSRILNFSKTDKLLKLIKRIIEDIYFMPLRTVGTIVATATLTNILFSVLLKRHVGFLGWIMRILLFVSFVGIFYNINKKGLKK